MPDFGEQADGRRFVGLYRPIKVAGRTIEGVTFEPMTYGHLISWQSGQYEDAHTLLLDLTGLTLAQLYALKRPDDQRVIEAFQAHVHPAIAADLEAGVKPVAQPAAGVRPGAPPAAGTDRPDIEPGSFADLALRAADRAEQRTAEQEAEELRLSALGDAAEDALDGGAGPGYSGAFGGDPADG